MKAIVKVLVALCFASVCAGFVYAHCNAEDYKVEQRTYVERIYSGDTVDTILQQYYTEADGDFREWKYNILHLPQNKHLLNQHGGLKLLQVGDEITIVTKVKVAK